MLGSSLTPLSLETLGFPTLTSFTAFLHGKTRVFPTPFHQLVQGTHVDKKITPEKKLFFRLLMLRACLAPIAKFHKFYLALNFLFVLFRPVVGAFALGTGKFDESVLGHVIK